MLGYVQAGLRPFCALGNCFSPSWPAVPASECFLPNLYFTLPLKVRLHSPFLTFYSWRCCAKHKYFMLDLHIFLIGGQLCVINKKMEK